MSRTDDTTKDRRDSTSPEARGIANLVRRMVVKLTRGPRWQALGHLLLDNTREAVVAENFSGIGFFARPKASHRTEAIVIHPSGAPNPIIIATRDEDARKAIAELDEDETAMFNSAVIVLIKGSTVEIRTAGGAAAALATKADLTALHSAISGAAVVPNDGGAAFKANILAALGAWPTGTVVLKAQ